MHGAARGADRLAGAAALRLGLEVVEYPADWKRHGRRAGYVRNEQMLAAGPDLVVAFHASLGPRRPISAGPSTGNLQGDVCVELTNTLGGSTVVV
jgi:hypothetical protein